MAKTLRGPWLWQLRDRKGWCGHQVWYGLLVAWILITAHVTISTRGHLQHPALNQACYDYDQTDPTTQLNNICCSLHNYTKRDTMTCIQRATNNFPQLTRYTEMGTSKKNSSDGSISMKRKQNIHIYNEYLWHFYHHPIKNSSAATQLTEKAGLPESVSIPYGKIKGWLWAIVGDSRMRQVFSALVTKLSSPRLKYKKPSTGGKWRSVHELTENLRIGTLHEDIEVYHMDLPIQLIFHWDPLLLKLPQLLDQWTNNEKRRPTLLLFGSGLHWMRATLPTYHSAGPNAALEKFQQQVESFLPQLLNFAKSTYTIIQLLDHIQESHIFKKYQGIYSNNNIDLYNSYLMKHFSDSSITLWDSNIPLSDIYYAKCRQNYKKSYDMLWICDNPLHTGFIMVEMYVNMLLNDVCNSFIDLDPTIC
ncbi:uncharacterized protein [Panulirus ornatus]|uniref:uncharacterized protein n=1 Tax=Panulirus ornatus TaxID=150431 RepID=UPI003A872F06